MYHDTQAKAFYIKESDYSEMETNSQAHRHTLMKGYNSKGDQFTVVFTHGDDMLLEYADSSGSPRIGTPAEFAKIIYDSELNNDKTKIMRVFVVACHMGSLWRLSENERSCGNVILVPLFNTLDEIDVSRGKTREVEGHMMIQCRIMTVNRKDFEKAENDAKKIFSGFMSCDPSMCKSNPGFVRMMLEKSLDLIIADKEGGNGYAWSSAAVDLRLSGRTYIIDHVSRYLNGFISKSSLIDLLMQNGEQSHK